MPRSRPDTGRNSPPRRWLYPDPARAELAGLDPAEVARSAIDSRDLAGARDIASVIDARIRQRVYPLLPQPQGPWSDRVPQLPDPGRHAYLTEIAAMMDDRKQRIGQHAAQHPPPWAITALGPVPDDPAARQEWQHKAASIGAYRETYGYHHPADPIGPEPTRDAPDQRAAWHEAFLALGPADGPDVRAMPDGRLWLIRDTYTAETAWAPRHVGQELRLVRLGAANADRTRSAPTPKPTPPARTATTTAPPGTRTWPPATGRCSDHYRQQETPSPRPWTTASSGNTPPSTPATWPSPPTPSCAAATPASGSSRCAPPNQDPSPTPTAPS